MNYYNNPFTFGEQTPYREFPKTIIYPRFNREINKRTTLNLSKILDTTQRGINTINQIVPLYKQVTPIIKQVSSFTKSINSFLFRKRTNSRNNVEENNINESIKNDNFSYREQNYENTPFFNKK